MNRTRTIVVAFSTLDGIIQDPAGATGPRRRLGLPQRAGGRRRGQVQARPRPRQRRPGSRPQDLEQFAQIFPSRTGEFDVAMNRIPKLVASRTLTDLSAFPNSSLMDGDLAQAVEKQKTERDVIVMGSASVVHTLAKRDLVDEYRILFFSSALGAGTRLFAAEATPAHFRLASAETSGQEILARYERPDS